MLAEVLHFYALGWNELLDLEVPWFCKLYARIPVIEARRLLALLPALTYPHLETREDRERLHAQLMRQAGYVQLRHAFLPDAAEVGDGWEKLRGLGNGTRR